MADETDAVSREAQFLGADPRRTRTRTSNLCGRRRTLAEFLGAGYRGCGAVNPAECECGDLVYVQVCASCGCFVEGVFTEFGSESCDRRGGLPGARVVAIMVVAAASAVFAAALPARRAARLDPLEAINA
jgi:hypothetical protein